MEKSYHIRLLGPVQVEGAAKPIRDFGSRKSLALLGYLIAPVAATMPPEVVAAAQVRGRARDVWETAEVLLKALEAESR